MDNQDNVTKTKKPRISRADASTKHLEGVSDRIRRRVETIPAKFRGAVMRAILGGASPRAAIKAKCFECCGFEDAYARVSECSVDTCPLHKYRPTFGDSV